MTNKTVVVISKILTNMLRDIRKQYDYSALNETEVDKNPFSQFEVWLQTAVNSDELEPTAMVLHQL